jgi:hypothetical protein
VSGRLVQEKNVFVQPSGVRPRSLRAFRIFAAILLLLIASVALVPTVRRPILQAAGSALVVDDPIGPADIIVIAVDAGGAGVLEAADLVHAGIATGVGIFADPPKPADRELIRRGIPNENNAARSARQLRSLGVATIEQIPETVAGTEAEGQTLLDSCARHQYRSVVVVSNSDHSRRLRRVLRRSIRGHGMRVAVRSARYSSFDPDCWWKTRGGIRTEIVELQKLLFDGARHPFS